MSKDLHYESFTDYLQKMIDERINQKLGEMINSQQQTAKNAAHKADDEYLNIQELCSLTGLKKNTVYGKRVRREIPAYKFGRELRFKKSEVETWIKSKSLQCLTKNSADHE